MSALRAVTVRSNAKINPVLRVLGRRDDGDHEVESLMLGLAFGGAVTVARDPDGAPGSIRVSTAGPFATPDIVDGPEHLALRGAAAARDVLGSDAALRVTVDKGVPSRAGLGGGSADAAAAARATLWLLGAQAAEERLAPDVLGRLGAIGADCGFFFAARDRSAALARGRGERLEPVDGTPGWAIAVLTPAVVCPTGAVYGATGMAPGRLASGALDVEACADLLGASASAARARIDNDLEEAALRAVPDLGDWLDLVDGAGGGHFTLAGSGASVFGLFDAPEEAAAAVEDILAASRGEDLPFRFACVTQAESSLLAVVEVLPEAGS